MNGKRLPQGAVLEALDPDLGGLTSGTAEEIWENLTDRGSTADLREVEVAIEALARSRKVERVEQEDGPAVYTRPEVLLRALGILKPSSARGRTRGDRPGDQP